MGFEDRVQIRLSREVFLNHSVELVLGLYAGDVGSKVACAWFALSIATCKLSHQHGTAMRPESLDHQIEVVQHDFPLLVDRWVRRNGASLEGRSRLREQPWLAQRSPRDHDPIDVVMFEGMDDLFGRF